MLRLVYEDGGEMHLRTVITHEYVGASRYTGYIAKSIRLVLECGHEQVRKASAGVPNRAHCHVCERMRVVRP